MEKIDIVDLAQVQSAYNYIIKFLTRIQLFCINIDHWTGYLTLPEAQSKQGCQQNIVISRPNICPANFLQTCICKD